MGLLITASIALGVMAFVVSMLVWIGKRFGHVSTLTMMSTVREPVKEYLDSLSTYPRTRRGNNDRFDSQNGIEETVTKGIALLQQEKVTFGHVGDV